MISFNTPEHVPDEMYQIRTKEFTKRIADNLFKKETHYCIRTQANLEPKCLGCGLCKSKEDLEGTIHKQFTTVDNIKEIQRIKNSKVHTDRYRVIYNLTDTVIQLYRKKFVQNYYVMSKINQVSDIVCDNYQEVINVSERNFKDQQNYWYGLHAFDFTMKIVEIMEDLTGIKEKANKLLEGIQILDIMPVDTTVKDSVGLYVYNTDMSVDTLQQYLMDFQSSNGLVDYIIEDKVVKDVYYFKNQDYFKLLRTSKGTKLVFPVYKEHPAQLLKSVLKQRSISNVLAKGKIQCIGLFEVDVNSLCLKHGSFKMKDLQTNTVVGCIKCVMEKIFNAR